MLVLCRQLYLSTIKLTFYFADLPQRPSPRYEVRYEAWGKSAGREGAHQLNAPPRTNRPARDPYRRSTNSLGTIRGWNRASPTAEPQPDWLMYYDVIFDPCEKSRVRLCWKWQQNETGALVLTVNNSGMDEWYVLKFGRCKEWCIVYRQVKVIYLEIYAVW